MRDKTDICLDAMLDVFKMRTKRLRIQINLLLNFQEKNKNILQKLIFHYVDACHLRKHSLCTSCAFNI